MRMALGVDSLDEVADRIRQFMDVKSPQGFLDKIKMLPMLAEMGKFFPRPFATGPCKEVIRKDNFRSQALPILQCWPKDAGRFITLPCVVTRDPKTGKRNVGMYRMQVYDGKTTGMHWQRQKIGAEHYREMLRAKLHDEDTFHPVARDGRHSVILLEVRSSVDIMARTSGGSVIRRRQIAWQEKWKLQSPSALILQSHFPPSFPLRRMSRNILIAGFLRQKPVELVKCETVDLEVPATAEIVLEGYVNLDELRTEGPFGDHTGFYSLEDLYPVFHVTCVTHRKNPIYATTIVGKPPQEDAYMGKAVERIFLPLMKLTIPELVDVNLPIEGVFHNLMIVSIRKSYPGQARKVMNAIWSLGRRCSPSASWWWTKMSMCRTLAKSR